MLEQFSALPRPSAPGRYSIESTDSRCRVGRSYEDYPTLLIAFANESASGASPRRLANIAYTPPSVVEVSSGSHASRTERLAVLECRVRDPHLTAYFFRIASAAILDDNQTVDEGAFEVALDSIVTLFRALQRPGWRTVQGLWAELAVIAWSSNPGVALSAWHSSPRALHDFSAGSLRLEVKGTTQPLREHSFRLEQLSTQLAGVTLIASLMLEELEQGASVFDLVDAIKERIGPGEPARRLDTVVAESLGSGWREAGGIRFDLQGAREALRLYAAQSIPTVPQPLPAEVKEVRFVVDLSTAPTVEIETAQKLGAFFADVLPRKS